MITDTLRIGAHIKLNWHGFDDSNIDTEVMGKIQKRIGQTMDQIIDQRTKQIFVAKDHGNWHQNPTLMPRFGCVIIDARMV